MSFASFYERNYKALMIIPLLLVVIAAFSLFTFYQKTGDIMYKDVSLKGGITATVYTDKETNLAELTETINKIFVDSNIRKLSEFGSNKQVGIIIEVGDLDETKLKTVLESFFGFTLTDENYSVEVVGSSLGASFYGQMSKAMLFAFLLMALVVIAIYRSVIPSLAVIAATSADILIALAAANFLGLRIGTAGIAALLLLIGYSVDDNMLLTTKILKNKDGKAVNRFLDAAKTGMTMTLTTLVALIIGFLVSTSPVLKEMFLIMFAGLIADIFMTYFMNAGILIWYAKRKGYD